MSNNKISMVGPTYYEMWVPDHATNLKELLTVGLQPEDAVENTPKARLRDGYEVKTRRVLFSHNPENLSVVRWLRNESNVNTSEITRAAMLDFANRICAGDEWLVVVVKEALQWMSEACSGGSVKAFDVRKLQSALAEDLMWLFAGIDFQP